MTEPRSEQTDEGGRNRGQQTPLMYFEGPWTEADEIWAECLTGEYDERLQREADERAAREADL